MDGAVTVHVLVVMLPPMYTNVTKLELAAVTGANDSQSYNPPTPLVNVTVTVAPRATVVALTVSEGGGATVNGSGADVPPPGAA